MSDIKYMDLNEFREAGFLQEVNRLFFHPLGLALEIAIDQKTNQMRLSGIRDYRESPEGCIFAGVPKEQALRNASYVYQEILNRKQARLDKLGWVIQPPTDLDVKSFEEHRAEEEEAYKKAWVACMAELDAARPDASVALDCETLIYCLGLPDILARESWD